MRFVPVRHHSLGCHGSAYISIPYGWCLADARSSPISKFFIQRSPLGSKTLVGVANALKSFRIPKTRKIGYFLNRKWPTITICRRRGLLSWQAISPDGPGHQVQFRSHFRATKSRCQRRMVSGVNRVPIWPRSLRPRTFPWTAKRRRWSSSSRMRRWPSFSRST